MFHTSDVPRQKEALAGTTYKGSSVRSFTVRFRPDAGTHQRSTDVSDLFVEPSFWHEAACRYFTSTLIRTVATELHLAAASLTQG